MSTKKIIYVGIDVDDKAFHGAGLNLSTGEYTQFKCKPDSGVLIKKLRTLFPDYEIRVCYEACHIGYPLHRSLSKAGIHCDIIAPSLIPHKVGKRVKTDRRDALKLAEFYAKDLLTPIYVPDELDEETRDVIRSRAFLVKQRKMLKTHILATCKRYDISYKQETDSKTNWTVTHIRWLRKRVKELSRETWKLDLEILLAQYSSITESIEKLETIIHRSAESPRYQKRVNALLSFRGLSTLSAMTLVTELGDIRRFPHPRQLTAYCGLDIAEYSSGGKEHKKGITKTGNRHIRTTLTESCQMAMNPPILSKRLKQFRASQPQEVVDIADRCMHRLYKKSTRMIFAGKHRNKAVTAASREMLGFIWEVLRAVA